MVFHSCACEFGLHVCLFLVWRGDTWFFLFCWGTCGTLLMAFSSNILVEYKILGQDIYCEPHVCSVRGHYSCRALTVLRWPTCDCTDNCYQQLVAAMLPELAFVCFGFTCVRNLSFGSFPSASPIWLIALKTTRRQEREGNVLMSVSMQCWQTTDAVVVVWMRTCTACVRCRALGFSSFMSPCM